MVVSKGNLPVYLRITLDYRIRGRVKITMFDYIEEIITAFEKASPGKHSTKSTAAPVNIFVWDKDCKKLNQNKVLAFHNLVTKTLYATKRSRPDTCTSISFFIMRVREPDEDDWEKLVFLMRYLTSTRTLNLILFANGSGILKWWVDAYFVVFPIMRGHPRGGLSIGRGFPIVGSTKQKLNSRSSTETDIVGVVELITAIFWTKYFLESQGCNVQDNRLLQANKSSNILE